MLFTLHPPHHTPGLRLVGNRKSDGFCTVLGNSVVIVLLGKAEVSSRPRQSTGRDRILNSHVEIHSSRVLVPLQSERCANRHDGGQVAGKPGVHITEATEIKN